MRLGVGGDGVEIHGAHRAPQLQRHAMGRALAHRLGIDVGDTPEIPNAAGGHLAIERTVKFSVAIGQVCFKVRTRSEEHTSELQSLMRISYAVFCLKKKTKTSIYSTG